MVKYEYKNTGIEWLSNIPNHWKATSIKKEFRVIPSNVDKKSADDETEVKLCNYVDVYYNDFLDSSIDYMIATANDGEIQKFKLNVNDVLITKDSEDPYDIAVPAVITEIQDNFICGYHLSMIRSINQKIDGKFLFWAIKDEAIASQLYREATGVTRWAIASRHIKNSTIPFPPLLEQHAIADYLDKACKRIDSIIDIKQKQLERIEGYFVSIRHKLLTQGINNTEFISHDDDFLKKTPAHWKKFKLRYILNLKNGKLITNEELVDDGEFPVYGGNGIMARTDKYNYEGEQIILGRVGAKCGNVHLTNEKIWVSDNAIAVKSVFDYRFMYHLLTVLDLHRLASETAQPLLVGNNVKKLYVAIPPKDEQENIISKVSKLEVDTKNLKAKLNAQITTLQTYRKSLIHECVTGKKQVWEGEIEKVN